MSPDEIAVPSLWVDYGVPSRKEVVSIDDRVNAELRLDAVFRLYGHTHVNAHPPFAPRGCRRTDGRITSYRWVFRACLILGKGEVVDGLVARFAGYTAPELVLSLACTLSNADVSPLAVDPALSQRCCKSLHG